MQKIMTTIILTMLTISCSSFKAERVGDKEADKRGLKITDNWMGEDTDNAVEEVIKLMKKHKGYQRVLARSAREPRIFIAEVQNNTSEAYFPINDFNDEFLNEISAMGDFVLVDNRAREKILEEITYQNDGMVSPETAKQIGKQLGADYLIFGNIYMKPEKRSGKTIKEYSVNLRMTNLETATEVFRVRTRVNKFSDKSSYSW